ncbi:hypothetical protein ACFLXP_05275 [Chloroflexota bacterium]
MILSKRILLSLLIVNLCAIGFTGCIPKSDYEALQSEATSLREENTELSTRLEQVQSDLEEIQSDYNMLNADYEILINEWVELTNEYGALQGELLEIKEVPTSKEQITLDYSWTYDGLEWTWDFLAPTQLYEYFQELPRPPTTNYSIYVSHPSDDIYIDELATKIGEAAHTQGYNELQTVEFVISFVQSLPYTSDLVTTPFDEYPRYPLETLVDKGGDCEDTSILLASLLHSMGYSSVLIMPPEHCAVGILGGEGIYGTYWEHEGGQYYYIETTNTGWSIGELPQEYVDTEADIYGVVPTPILTYHWEAQQIGTVIKLETTINNVGTATAEDVYVFAGFDTGGDNVWNPEQSELFQLLINQNTTVTLLLKLPTDEHTRLIVQIVDGGYAVETSYSEWFDN